VGLCIAAYGTRAFIKILCEERRQLIKNLKNFLVDNLRVYCCEPSQRTGKYDFEFFFYFFKVLNKTSQLNLARKKVKRK
jgi:hypothetical protein